MGIGEMMPVLISGSDNVENLLTGSVGEAAEEAEQQTRN
jgi:hypothetical protein